MMQGAVIVEERQAADSANGQADGMLAPAIEGRPEMSTRPSHVQQTLPNGQVGYVRQDSTRGPSRGSQGGYATESGAHPVFDPPLTDARGQDIGAMAAPATHKSP